VRCPRCGNENPELNRFCGMCGATLIAAPPPAITPPERGAGDYRPPSRSSADRSSADHNLGDRGPAREAEPVSQPIISGPSFLGLSQPGPARAPRTAGRGSPLETSSRSLDYLLEDDEEEPKSGAGKLVLVLVALALALGLGYLRWRSEGLEWLTSGMKKTLTGASSETSSQPGANAGGDNSAAANPPAAGGAPATSAAAQPGAQMPAGDASTAANARTPVPVAADAPSATATNPPANSGAVLGSSTNAGTASGAASPPDTGGNPAPLRTSAPVHASAPPTSAPAISAKNGSGKAGDEDADSSDDDSTPAAKPAAPPAKPPAAKPVDPVVAAEKYIYGRGVAQDCDRGLKILRPAANEANAKAMISLGALYSAGLCTPRDLPTAYRWFAMALRKEPDNDSLQTDLQKLWSEMTQPERQLAIKLSQ
jgi:TPR repeat protein